LSSRQPCCKSTVDEVDPHRRETAQSVGRARRRGNGHGQANTMMDEMVYIMNNKKVHDDTLAASPKPLCPRPYLWLLLQRLRRRRRLKPS